MASNYCDIISEIDRNALSENENNANQEDPSDNVNETKIHVGKKNLSYIADAINIDFEFNKLWYQSFVKVFENCSIISHINRLEDVLLSLSASKETDGILYFNIIESTELKLTLGRTFKSGIFNDFMDKEAFKEIGLGEFFQLDVYNDKDVDEEFQRSKKIYQHTTEPKEKKVKRSSYERLLKGNKNSVVNCVKYTASEVDNLEGFECKGFGVVVCRNGGKFNDGNQNNNRYCSFQRLAEAQVEKLQSLVLNTLTFNVKEEVSLFDKLHDTPLDLYKQFRLLSSIPNYHKWEWQKQEKSSKVQIKFEQRFSSCMRYHAGSPRNRLINAVAHPRENCFEQIDKTLNSLLGFNPQEFHALAPPVLSSSDKIVTSSKNKKHRPAINEEDICEFLGVTVLEANSVAENMFAGLGTSLYNYYIRQLLSNGKPAWRLNTPVLQVLLLNDYDSEHGDFKEYDYVHVKCMNGDRIECTCQTFSIVECALKTKSSEEMTSGWSGISCCHVRFLSELLRREKEVRTDESTILKLEAKEGVERFSVATSTDVEFVTVFRLKNTLRKVVKCHSSFCQHKQGKTRSISSLNSSSNLCEHLMLFKTWFQASEGTSTHDELSYGFEDMDLAGNELLGELEDDVEAENSIDRLLPKAVWEDIFNEETGVWTFHKGCISKTTDSDQFSPKLEENIRKRYSACLLDTAYQLIAPLKDESCQCEAGWISEEHPEGMFEHVGRINVYTTIGCIQNVQVFNRRCLSGECSIQYDGHNDDLFISSSSTACGNEIGWEYVDQVMASRQTFTGFCKTMESKYKRSKNSARFLSPKVFIKWWFAWASSMKIDFRKQCQMCNGNIDYLACDGTKIGMGLNSTFIIPIEEVSNDDEKIQTPNRRYDRTFITNSDCTNVKERLEITSHLRYLCNLIIGNVKQQDLVPEEICRNLTLRLLSIIPAEMRPIFQLFIQGGMEYSEQQSLAKVFLVLASDCSLDVIFPRNLITPMKEFVENCNSNDEIEATKEAIVSLLKKFFPELGDVIIASHQKHGKPTQNILKFISVVINKVEHILLTKVEPAEAAEINNSYNPPRYGRAYYFNKTGNQVRVPRSFSMDNESPARNIFDDKPNDACQKYYHQITKQGTTFLFLWFCPLHGHCYGFHIISGSDGRKDPAASLYCYMDKAPKTVFYDFACSLSEYTQNRESGFYKDTRFFHDIFHGYSHKCSAAFRSSRLNNISGLNTSICEQFNSFLQCIKASSRLMTQEHFTFYVQFFIDMWNNAKQKSFQRKLHVAYAGNK